MSKLNLNMDSRKLKEFATKAQMKTYRTAEDMKEIEDDLKQFDHSDLIVMNRLIDAFEDRLLKQELLR